MSTQDCTIDLSRTLILDDLIVADRQGNTEFVILSYGCIAYITNKSAIEVIIHICVCILYRDLEIGLCYGYSILLDRLSEHQSACKDLFILISDTHIRSASVVYCH